MWLGFLLRLVVAVWNGFYGPSFGAEGDATGMHEVAVAYSRTFEVDRFYLSLLYAYALGLIYYVTIPSLFLGSVLSCFAWLASAHVLLKTMRLLSIRRRQRFGAMFVYALLPSSILWTAVTLREPYQLLVVNVAIYAALKIFLHKANRHWITLFCASGIGLVLHGAVFAFGLFLLVATSAATLFRRPRRLPIRRLLVAAPFAVAVLVYGYSLFTSSYSYGIGDGMDLTSAIESYQRGGLSIDARTHYKSSVAIDGVTGLLLFVPVSLLQYLFEPMPWRISAVADGAPLLENVLRAWLISKALARLRHLRSARRISVLLVFASYLVLETIWSVGTVNWGTSARHHIPAIGLLVLAAYARMRKRVPSAVRLNPDAGGLLPEAASA